MTDIRRKDQWIQSDQRNLEKEVAMLQVDLASGTPTTLKQVDVRETGPLARAKEGDQAAFAELVREHQGMVFSLARYFLHDRETAEELAQDVFLSLYHNLAAIESPLHLKFWLRKVTSHRCIDYTRKNRLKTVSVDQAPEPFSMFDLPDALMLDALRRIVATLPEKPRLVIQLRYQEDLDPTEIAEILEMPLNTVKSHLRRSLAILREKVGRSLGETL
jgi:RNA polymerase sigma-70 factor (ECF subfamily)